MRFGRYVEYAYETSFLSEALSGLHLSSQNLGNLMTAQGYPLWQKEAITSSERARSSGRSSAKSRPRRRWRCCAAASAPAPPSTSMSPPAAPTTAGSRSKSGRNAGARAASPAWGAASRRASSSASRAAAHLLARRRIFAGRNPGNPESRCSDSPPLSLARCIPPCYDVAMLIPTTSKTLPRPDGGILRRSDPPPRKGRPSGGQHGIG